MTDLEHEHLHSASEAGGRCHATLYIDLSMRPLHVPSLQPARYKGALKIYTRAKEMRFLSDAKPVIIEEAMQGARGYRWHEHSHS